jgi:hypothetical protein
MRFVRFERSDGYKILVNPDQVTQAFQTEEMPPQVLVYLTDGNSFYIKGTIEQFEATIAAG